MAGYAPGDIVKKRFVIREALGQGRLGVAVKAVDKEKNKPVVLKFIHPGLIPDSDSGMRFLTAMNAIKSLGDARLAAPIEAARDQGKYFIAREFLVGVSLKQLMDDQRICGQVFPTEEALQILEKLARALVSIRGGCHGAFSPSKIWVLAKDLKIVDYGLAASLPAEAVWHNLRQGRGAAYVAPERIDNRPPDPKTDVFSLGVLLGELLSLAEFDGAVEVFRDAEPDLSPEMEALIRCSLSADTDARYDHPMEFVSALYDITGRPRTLTMPPDNTAVVPVAFLNQLRSMSQVPSPNTEPKLTGSIPNNETGRPVAVNREEEISTTPPPPLSPPIEESSAGEPVPYAPPPFRPTDLGALARATAKKTGQAGARKAPPPSPGARKSLLPPVPSVDRPLIPKPNDTPAVLLKAPQPTSSTPRPSMSATQPPRPSMAAAVQPPRPSMAAAVPPPRPSAAAAVPPPGPSSVAAASSPLPAPVPAVKKQNDEISALKAMLTPRAIPAFKPPTTVPMDDDDDDFAPIDDSAIVEEVEKDKRPTADSMETIDRYEGINPRFLRAAAKLEQDKSGKRRVPSETESDPDEEAWRKEIEASSAGSVVSFLPPGIIDPPPAPPVKGSPQHQRQRAPKGTMRPVAPPKPPPLPRKK